MNAPPAPDFEDSEYQPRDRPAPALKPGDNAAPNPPALPMRGEVFDVELDENGRLIEAAADAPKRSALWFFAGLAALFCAYNVGAYVGQKSKTPVPIAAFASPPEKPKSLRLQISGRVKKPGVYTLPGSSRIEDALQKAGGALPNADLSGLNLADWAVDGSKIEVPARRSAKIAATPTPQVIIKEVFVTPPQNLPGEAASETETAPDESPKPAATQTESRPKAKAGKTSQSALAALRRSPIDLNRASAEQLAVLPGVGPKMAARILIYRRENGGFKSVSDLDNVQGIGEKRMEVLKDLVKIK